MTSSRLEARLKEAQDKGRTALIPFLPAGFPDKNRFFDELKALDRAGADIIEIGIPFSDPVADGPVVEAASQECLARGASLAWLFQELPKHRSELSAEIVLMGYVNPFMQFGWSDLAEKAAALDLAGMIIPDLPLEESPEIEAILTRHQLDLIPLVGLNTSPERMHLYADRARGFVYFVSILGITGAKNVLSPELKSKLEQARQIFTQPLALGFGLSSPDQVQSVQGSVDAVVFGSALIEHIRQGGSGGSFLRSWRSGEQETGIGQ